MNSPDLARNLYVSHLASPALRTALDDWDRALVAARPLPTTRWQKRRHAFLRAAATSASTRIEGNQLSLWDADQLLAGFSVEGRERDQRELRNCSAAIDLAADFRHREPFAWHEAVLQQLNATVMRGLENDTRGAYRTGPVTVGGGFYSAPDSGAVPATVSLLLAWLRETEAHPLVRAALLHLNLAAIHPWFDGNGRTTRIACLLDLTGTVATPGWVDIEPALAADQDGYFRRIREAVGMSWDPENHTATDWVEWYAGMHVDVLSRARAVDEAERRDIVVITGALESRGHNPDWGPVILTAAYGSFTTGTVARMYGLSDSAARVMVGRMVEAGWLGRHGQTRGRTYRPTERIEQLDLESPGMARASAVGG